MSNPKRYTHKHLYGSDGYINESLFSDEKDCVAPEGEYVLHEDYARLKAEVERLTADNEQLQNRCDFLEGKQP